MQLWIGIIAKKTGVVKYGITVYQKKPEYGPAIIELSNTELINSKTDMLIEKGSKVNREGLIIYGKEKKLADVFYR